jgi:hypothetical protein
VTLLAGLRHGPHQFTLHDKKVIFNLTEGRLRGTG